MNMTYANLFLALVLLIVGGVGPQYPGHSGTTDNAFTDWVREGRPPLSGLYKYGGRLRFARFLKARTYSVLYCDALYYRCKNVQELDVSRRWLSCCRVFGGGGCRVVAVL